MMWDGLIKTHVAALREQIDEMELSALSACIGDCYGSFQEVYDDLLEKLNNADQSDYDLIHDCVVDMYWQFDHIKNHIADAEKGFTALMNVLAKKAELKQKEG